MYHNTFVEVLNLNFLSIIKTATSFRTNNGNNDSLLLQFREEIGQV